MVDGKAIERLRSVFDGTHKTATWGRHHSEELFNIIEQLREQIERQAESIEYTIEDAIKLAQLWREGKLIGGDDDGCRNALLIEVERLRGICPHCTFTYEQCSSVWPMQQKCCPDCEHHKMVAPKRMQILARFIRNQVSLADRPPPGCIQLNNEEATVCAIALERLAP